MSPLARIANLIPSLGRDNEHEIVATVRAIGAVLKGAGHDFCDLADFVRNKAAQANDFEPVRSSASWAPSHRAWQAKTDHDRATWLAMYGGAALTAWETSFVDSLVRQLSRRGATMSAKQSARLGEIFARVSRSAA